MEASSPKEKKAPVVYRNGRLYFTKEFERKLFFVLTVIMMLWGALAKIGLR